MNEIKPFKKTDPEVEKRTKDRERIAQFYYDCIACDLPLPDMRALAEARGLPLEEVLMAATIKRFFDIKHLVPSSVNARSIEKPKKPCDNNEDQKDFPSQKDVMFSDSYGIINDKGDFHPMLHINALERCANKCKNNSKCNKNKCKSMFEEKSLSDIMINPKLACLYAINVLKRPWKDAEPYIKMDTYWWEKYLNFIWPKTY